MKSEKTLSEAARILLGGGIVAFPTETVYGLGAAAFNAKAVARIFELKQRPLFDPLIVHIANMEMLPLLAREIPPTAEILMKRFWPGPLTLVLKKTARVPELVTAGLPTVAVRMPDHPLALALIRRAGTPVAAPSANPFGGISPTRAAHVREKMREQQADLILDGGPAKIGIESTIIALTGAQPELLRPGGLPIEEIEKLAGPVSHAETGENESPRAPGMLSRHYAPRTPLQLSDGPVLSSRFTGKRVGALVFRAVESPARFTALEVLSPAGDLREAAANLFGALHRLDSLKLDFIAAERVPDTGLGKAINDRLTRAASGISPD